MEGLKPMRRLRVFVEETLIAGTRLRLPVAAARHLTTVLRQRVGDSCWLFCGDGLEYPATLVQVDRHGVWAELAAPSPGLPPPRLRLTLMQGVARGEKMDWILQKATELGVSSIVPVITQRTEVRLDGERLLKRQAHWHGVIVSATEQSGRSELPVLHTCVDLAEALSALGDTPATLRITLDPGAERSLGHPDLGEPGQVVLLVGPEGGLSEQDRALALRAGFVGTRLGPRILRTETAGMAALAALQWRWGDLGD
jgi:16S rRNA (uracil1498-N3)-methyltransferase